MGTDLFKTFDVLFRNFFSDAETFSSLQSRIGYPVDVTEVNGNLTIEVACTGVDREDIKVAVKDDQLQIQYQKPEEESKEDTKSLYRGIARGSFNLGWKIAPKYDLNKISVKLDKGILTVTVPAKAEETPDVRWIEVQ